MKPALVAEARGEHARHLRRLQVLRPCHLAEEERSPLPARLIGAKVLRGFQRHVLTPRLFWVSRQSFLKHEALDHRWVAEERLERILAAVEGGILPPGSGMRTRTRRSVDSAAPA